MHCQCTQGCYKNFAWIAICYIRIATLVSMYQNESLSAVHVYETALINQFTARNP